MKIFHVYWEDSIHKGQDTVEADYVEINQNGDALFMKNAPNCGLAIYAKGLWVKILEVKE